MIAAAAVAGCQPKPTTPTTGAASAAPGPVAVVPAQLAPGQVVQLADGRMVQAPAATAVPAPVTTPAAPAVPGPAQPVPAYNDAGPPPVVAQAPVAAPAPARVPSHSTERTPARTRAIAPVPSEHYGRVTAVEALHERPSGTGAGGVAGGALGAIVGNQFGHGNGRAALTVLGLAGGAIAGNNVERNLRERTVGYRVQVQLDDGDTRTVRLQSASDFRVGDRVKLSNGGSLRRV